MVQYRRTKRKKKKKLSEKFDIKLIQLAINIFELL